MKLILILILVPIFLVCLYVLSGRLTSTVSNDTIKSNKPVPPVSKETLKLSFEDDNYNYYLYKKKINDVYGYQVNKSDSTKQRVIKLNNDLKFAAYNDDSYFVYGEKIQKELQFHLINKVIVFVNGKAYRKFLDKDEPLPKDHISYGFYSRIIDNAPDFEEFPIYNPKMVQKTIQNKYNNEKVIVLLDEEWVPAKLHQTWAFNDFMEKWEKEKKQSQFSVYYHTPNNQFAKNKVRAINS